MTRIAGLSAAAILLSVLALDAPAQALPGTGLQTAEQGELIHQVRSRHGHRHHHAYRHRGRHVTSYRSYRAPYYYGAPYAYAPPIGLYFGGVHGGFHHRRHHGHH
ncbi:MAG: hypothetical protein NW205_02245 [Hyphomicrobiaceae bacterium]|jgi:hypothetical protein|nr:hypothetical protein [Hyphomicrobiaceae bacterium]